MHVALCSNMDTNVTYLNNVTDAVRHSDGKCPVCGDHLNLGLEVVQCRKCFTLHHKECFKYNQICSTYGCGCSGTNPFVLPSYVEGRIPMKNTGTRTLVQRNQRLRYGNPEPFYWDSLHYAKYHFLLFCSGSLEPLDYKITQDILSWVLAALVVTLPFLLLIILLNNISLWLILTVTSETWVLARKSALLRNSHMAH